MIDSLSRPACWKVLELFCGIGGCAAALRRQDQVLAAIDINQIALTVYRHNFPHPATARSIESIDPKQFVAWQADLWWMSPPCQPYTQRGRQRDLADPRAASFLASLKRIQQLQPPHLAVENVPAFQDSQARQLLLQTLQASGYRFQEQVWCSTQLGLPNRRPRYYLIASRLQDPCWKPIEPVRQTLPELLDDDPLPECRVDDSLLTRYAQALHIIEASDAQAVANCFTSAYGRSPVRSGSYLADGAGVRRFSPQEILRFLGFPPQFKLPTTLTLAQAYRLVGNSLSVPVVRHVLSGLRDETA